MNARQRRTDLRRSKVFSLAWARERREQERADLILLGIDPDAPVTISTTWGFASVRWALSPLPEETP